MQRFASLLTCSFLGFVVAGSLLPTPSAFAQSASEVPEKSEAPSKAVKLSDLVRLQGLNYYDLLQVTPSQAQDDGRHAELKNRTFVEAARVQLLRRYHPDLAGTDDNGSATREFANREEVSALVERILEAANTLSDPQRRADYDRLLVPQASVSGKSFRREAPEIKIEEQKVQAAQKYIEGASDYERLLSSLRSSSDPRQTDLNFREAFLRVARAAANQDEAPILKNPTLASRMRSWIPGAQIDPWERLSQLTPRDLVSLLSSTVPSRESVTTILLAVIERINPETSLTEAKRFNEMFVVLAGEIDGHPEKIETLASFRRLFQRETRTLLLAEAPVILKQAKYSEFYGERVLQTLLALRLQGYEGEARVTQELGFQSSVLTSSAWASMSAEYPRRALERIQILLKANPSSVEKFSKFLEGLEAKKATLSYFDARAFAKLQSQVAALNPVAAPSGWRSWFSGFGSKAKSQGRACRDLFAKTR